MDALPVTHPSAESLHAYGLGKLDEAAAKIVQGHLESCTTCSQEVAAQTGDSFLAGLRRARETAGTPMPPTLLAGVAHSLAPAGPVPTTPPVIPDLPPELAAYPDYEVARELGRGGMGVVYLARNRRMERLEVLKVMGKDLLAAPGARARFEREIRSAAQLNHQNVVTAYSVLPLEGLLVFAMEYVEGQNLATVVEAKGPLPVINACYYAHQVAHGLQHAHEKKMVHRDIKPQNLMLAPKSRVKILDFGLAKAKGEGAGGYDLTGEGRMLGTPHYVAPEQIQDAATADIRADLYSLGCTLHFLLTGGPPFEGQSLYAILQAHQLMDAKPLNQVRTDVSAELAAVVKRMMAKDLAKRFQTPAEVAQALVPFIKSAMKGAPSKPPPELSMGTAAQAGGPVAPSAARVVEAVKQLPVPDKPPPVAWDVPTEDNITPARPRPSGPVHKERPPKGRFPLPWLVGMAGALLAAVIAGIVLFWPTPRGVVKIESDDPSVEIVFDKTGPTVKGAGKEPITLGAGEHGVLIKRGDFEFEADKFVLKKGATITLKVERLEGKIQVTADGRVIGAGDLPPVAALDPSPGGPLPQTFTNNLGMEFVLVPKGKSWLGGGGVRPGDKEVVIAHDFYLGKYEVTQEEWQKVTGLTPSGFSRTGWAKDEVKDMADAELKRFPVERVSWDDAQAFLEHLNKREKEAGWVYRLPKEAEWEYACRGGPLSDKFKSAYDFYFDKPTNQLLPGQANFEHGKGLKRTCKVGSYKPNRLGLYDMHGNVWEWCDDAEQSADGASRRVIRGGCFNDAPAWRIRAADRLADPPSYRHCTRGLRVARVPAGKEVVKIPPEEQKPAVVVPSPPAVGPKPDVATTAPKISGRPFLVRGDWTIENDELVQPTLAGDYFCPLLVFGEATLSNYDLTLQAKKTGGGGSIGIYFHWLGPGHYRYIHLSGNKGIDFAYVYNGQWGRENGNWRWLSYSSNHWYSLHVETRGDTCRGYLDGVLQFEQPDARFTHGRICLVTSNAAARFRRIKVNDPQGKVLFEGRPELPPASNKTTPKTNIGNSSRVQTAGETAAKSAQQQWAERLKTPLILTNSLAMKLALIPPGEFQMGSPESERQPDGHEQQHRVRITKPFYLGVYEVTQSEFEHVMGRNPRSFSNSGGPTEAATGVDTTRYPVENVTWYDAVEFCNKLSEKEGRPPYYRIAGIERHVDGWIKEAKVSVEGGDGYRLPTEAQWEYACRAGTTTPFNFGTANNGAESNCNGKAPYGTEEPGPALGSTVQVGSYRPNGFGLYDMHGNVWEWCWDVFDEGYYKNSPESDPAGSSGGSLRVLRGGCWRFTASHCRAAFRGTHTPGGRGDYMGFRVARVPSGG